MINSTHCASSHYYNDIYQATGHIVNCIVCSIPIDRAHDRRTIWDMAWYGSVWATRSTWSVISVGIGLMVNWVGEYSSQRARPNAVYYKPNQGIWRAWKKHPHDCHTSDSQLPPPKKLSVPINCAVCTHLLCTVTDWLCHLNCKSPFCLHRCPLPNADW